MDGKISFIVSLESQREQLKRLINSKMWISDEPKPTPEEMASQIAQLKSLIDELEQLIQRQPR